MVNDAAFCLGGYALKVTRNWPQSLGGIQRPGPSSASMAPTVSGAPIGAKTDPRRSGRIPLVLHLLAPNGRCQQITDDLASFWKNTYPVVRKELRGRYPKHRWPEDPHQLG